MTKLNIDPGFEHGLSDKREIAKVLAGKTGAPRSRIPTWLGDAFQLLVSASVGGLCAWVGYKIFL